MVNLTNKRGDTLVEVTIAIGIFSMIAIAVVAVMSSGTSGAQTALETTLTREEIDTQAEALRFIQTAYAANRNETENNNYASLWRTITNNVIDISSLANENYKEEILQYHPDNCSEMYNNREISNRAFVINPRTLGTFVPNETSIDSYINSVYITHNRENSESKNILTTATIYPRLVFSSSSSEDTLLSDSSGNTLEYAEGIYVIAVKDSNTTAIAGKSYNTGSYDPGNINKTPAFYDFYIRTCWYGTDADEPSTISTVIRLYDPDAVVLPAN